MEWEKNEIMQEIITFIMEIIGTIAFAASGAMVEWAEEWIFLVSVFLE